MRGVDVRASDDNEQHDGRHNAHLRVKKSGRDYALHGNRDRQTTCAGNSLHQVDGKLE